jgi:hypothetical protein
MSKKQIFFDICIGILQQKQIGLKKLFLNSRFLKLLTQESNDSKRFASK